MRKHLFIFLFIAFAFSANAQNEEVHKLVDEGIALHDEGKYNEAIKKYDEALLLDKEDFIANYEKSLSLLSAKRYKECIDVCKFLISKHKNNPELKSVYTNYGSALDDMGEPKEAIKVYNKGLDKFPDSHMLHFNKGVTYQKLEKWDDALECYTQAMKFSPFHPSSNYYTGTILETENKIASLLAYLVFVISEPESDRTETAFKAVEKLMGSANVKKDGNTTTIFLPASSLDKKDKKKENDFSSVEFMFVFFGGLDEAKGMDSLAHTPAEKFDFKLQLLINGLTNNQKDGKGFYWKHYVPFFIEMKEAKMTTTFSRLLYRSSDKEADEWITQNPDKLKEFYTWVSNYDWPRK